MSAPVTGSLSIFMTRLGSPVARSIHMGKTCSRDRLALPTGFPQKTQFVHPGSFGAFPRCLFWDIGEENPGFLRVGYRPKRFRILRPAFFAL
jgi:hypothetical protein